MSVKNFRLFVKIVVKTDGPITQSVTDVELEDEDCSRTSSSRRRRRRTKKKKRVER